MTAFTAFQPPPNNTFSFQPVLDGSTCSATVWWNVAGQRWFVSVASPNGAAIFNLPLIGSPPSQALQALQWSNGSIFGTTAIPHGYTLLSTVELTISGCQPVEYNGRFSCFIVSPVTFRYSLNNNPGGTAPPDEVTQLGNVSYDINMGAGYLKNSTFVFREASQMFEVSP